jgi:hypothetical protein
VWYDITPPADEVLRLQATGQSSTTLAVYTGSAVNSLSSVTGCSYFGQPVMLNATGGATYHIRVAAFPFDAGGLLTLDVEEVPPPPNDDFANATIVSSLPFSDTADTTAASVESGEPTPSCGYGQSAGTVWWAFTPSQSGSYSASASGFSAQVAAYTGSGLASLSEIGCRAFAPLTVHFDSGTTYYFQVGGLFGGRGTLTFNLDVAPKPVAAFSYSPPDPSVFDTVQFSDQSYDPGGNSFSSEVWHFGDGTTASNPGCCPTHKYANDGDYTVELDVTTTDGRTASTSQVVQVRTHDVSIIRLAVPASAHVGQTIAINVYVQNKHYPETVQVDLSKSIPGGFGPVGSLIESVPVKRGGQSTRFAFTYTVTSDDKAAGKMTFRAIAGIIGHRDALPADNELLSTPVRIV